MHDYPNLSVIEKFNHLINSLQDDALRSVIWNAIYDKKSLKFKDHVTSLFELKKMGKPLSSDLYCWTDIVVTVSAVLDSFAIKDQQLDYKKLLSLEDCSSVLIKKCVFIRAIIGDQIIVIQEISTEIIILDRIVIRIRRIHMRVPKMETISLRSVFSRKFVELLVVVESDWVH